MKIGKFEITASRWPWQKGYNWRGMTNSSAPLNMNGARFGGGWRYKLGVSWGSSFLTPHFDLLFGMISVNKMPRCKVCNKHVGRKERQGFWGLVKLKGYTEKVSIHELHKHCHDAFVDDDTPKEKEVSDEIPF